MNLNEIPNKEPGSELTNEEFNAVVQEIRTLGQKYETLKQSVEGMVEPTIDSPTNTTVALGGIPVNSNLNGLIAVEVLDRALFAELYPTTLTNPSYSFNISPSGLIEVGTSVNVVKTRNFSRGAISPQYLSDSPYRSGDVIDYTESGSDGPFVVVLGTTNWTSKANYAIGVQPRGSKGTAMPNVTPLPAGSTSTVTKSIIGVYPVYATTVSVTVDTKQPLLNHGSDIEVELAAETPTNKQKIKIPQAWGNITTLQQLNPLSNQWDTISLSTFSPYIEETINGVVYRVYTHNGDLIGKRRLKFKL